MGNEQSTKSTGTVSSPSELSTRLSVSLARFVSWLYIDLISLWTIPEGIHLVSFTSLPAAGEDEGAFYQGFHLTWT